jgi:hypothetical protein
MQRLLFFLISQKIWGVLGEILLICVDTPVFLGDKINILINLCFVT